MSYDLLGLHFQLGLQTLVECCHLLFLKVCICLLLFVSFFVYIFIIQPLFISKLLDIERASSFIKYTAINKGFIPLHGYFIFNISLVWFFHTHMWIMHWVPITNMGLMPQGRYYILHLLNSVPSTLEQKTKNKKKATGELLPSPSLLQQNDNNTATNKNKKA